MFQSVGKKSRTEIRTVPSQSNYDTPGPSYWMLLKDNINDQIRSMKVNVFINKFPEQNERTVEKKVQDVLTKLQYSVPDTEQASRLINNKLTSHTL